MARRALLVGLNRYPDPENTLRGCINDVRQVEALLRARFGFDDEGAIRLLTDAEATTRAIVSALHWLVDEAAAGDALVFHYSGHGSQVPDRHGDEADGLDEILCPYDLDWDDPLTDDDLGAIVDRLPADATLTVILDCCHSGTGLRAAADHAALPRSRFLHPPARLRQPRRRDAAVRRFGEQAAARGAILIAGCRSDQTAADADIAGEYHGAHTFYLCQAIEELDFAGSYRAVVARTRRLLEMNGYEQVPQLEGPKALLGGRILAPATETVSD